METVFQIYAALVRYLLPVAAIVIYVLVRRGMLRQPKNDRVLAVLEINSTQIRLPVTNYETSIGSSSGCDVVINMPDISRQHAVLTLNENGYWRVNDTKSKGGTRINGIQNTQELNVRIGDVISLAGETLTLLPADAELDPYGLGPPVKKGFDRHMENWFSRHPKREPKPLVNLLWLNLFQLLALGQAFATVSSEYYLPLLVAFFVVMALPWLWQAVGKLAGITNKSAEIIAFFLTTLGLCTTASAAPDDIIKQTIAFVAGFALFCALLVVLNNLQWAMRLRRYAAIASFLLLAITLVPGIGANINGQRNWIRIGSWTLQPSEFAKILFVFAGAATLQWLLTTKNLLALSVYSVGCMGILFLTGDFGAAIIFFLAFLVLILMTSGDFRYLLLVGGAAVAGVGIILRFKPYIANRFSLWGNVFSDVYGLGWQQSRTLMSIASGGMFGLGAGAGSLKRVGASDTDLIFGILCEEWGLIMGIVVLLCVCLFLRGAIRSGQNTRSSYYTIAACTAGAIFVFQASLNVFGCTDILPFTGVTLPFISNGGSSMMASWCMLAFFTAALNYTRPNVEAITVPVQHMDTGRKKDKRKYKAGVPQEW